MLSMFAGMSLLALVLIVPIALAIHFLPAIIAFNRKARNFWGIFAVNFFLGWTFIGWIVALVWALRDDPQ